MQATNYTISGNVKTDGANLQGATVALGGTQTASVLTGADGNYSFTAAAGGNYTVSVYKNGFNFNPTSQTFNNLQPNQIANFQNGAPLCAPPSSGLLALYRGEGNANDSIGANHGSPQNGASFAAGKVAQAFSFDGIDDGVAMGSLDSIQLTDAVTLQAWINPGNVPEGQFASVITKWNNSSGHSSYGLWLYKSGGQLQVHSAVRIYNIATATYSAFGITGGSIPVGSWSHVAMTYDITSNSLRVYLNGNLSGYVNNAPQQISLARTSTNAFIGRQADSGAGGYYFPGLIDEAQIYNRALSQSEIYAVYNAGSAGICDSCTSSVGLQSLWKAEDNALDMSGANHGTLQNGTTFAAGKFGQAFSFDGVDDYVKFASAPSNDFGTGDFSVGFWAKFNDLITDHNGLISKDSYSGVNNGNYNGWLFNINQSQGGIGLEVRNTSVNSVSHARYPISNFATQTWYHFVGVRRSGKIELYVNGVLRAAATETVATNVSNNAELRIGALTTASPQYFAGLIDETQIYNRALSLSEIQTIYNGGNASSCQNASFTNARPNSKIAFSSFRVGSGEIFTMNADGSNQTNISNNAADDRGPAFSPDGSKVAFTSYRNNNQDIYVMNADGSNQTRLTTDAAADTVPSWSPDGTKIVFSSNRNNNDDIYVMNPDGTNQTRLTTNAGVDHAPKFSPDGLRVVFYSERDGNAEIYVMNTDGSNQTRLTNNSAFDGFSVFSPDGSKIAFLSLRTGYHQIFVMNANGSNQVNLSNNLSTDQYPAWSSDGTKIAFDSTRSGGQEIYVMNADGTNPTQLTNNTTADVYSAWQPVLSNVTVSPASNVSLTFSNVTRAGNTVATPIALASAGVLPAGYQLLASSVAYDIRTSAAYSGDVTVAFRVSSVPDVNVCYNLRPLHYETTNNPLADITTGVSNLYDAATQTCTVTGVTTSLSTFVIAHAFAPTAATASVGGRVTTATGSGIRNALVTLTDSSGNSRTTLTGKFGAYRFRDVAAGETYIISVSAKRFTFSQSSQVRTVTEDLTDVDFIADEN